MAWASALLSLLVALVLASAAAHKLIAVDRLAAATARLARLPLSLGLPVMLGAATVEATAAIAVLLGETRSSGAILAASLWSVYGAALFAARRRGESEADCGCNFSPSAHGIGRFTVLRAFGLALLAALAAFMPAPAAYPVDTLFAAFALFALLAAAGELAALPPLRRSPA